MEYNFFPLWSIFGKCPKNKISSFPSLHCSVYVGREDGGFFLFLFDLAAPRMFCFCGRALYRLTGFFFNKMTKTHITQKRLNSYQTQKLISKWQKLISNPSKTPKYRHFYFTGIFSSHTSTHQTKETVLYLPLLS